MKQLSTILFAGSVGLALILQNPSAALGQEKVLHSFGSTNDGRGPDSDLMNVKGVLYGTTVSGGAGTCYDGCGTVFGFDPRTGAESVIYSFLGGADGQYPGKGHLIDVRGTVYGTTSGGGANGDYGTIFSLNITTGVGKVLYSFCSHRTDHCNDGNGPYAGLVVVNGTLYGVTGSGGAYNFGALFAVDLKSGAETVVHSFGGGSDGQTPAGGLIDVRATLYGTTETGGANGFGTVFALDLNSGVETVLYSFGNGNDGKIPVAGLTDENGTLYGTTVGGGNHDAGTVFSLDPRTRAEKVVYSFCSRHNCADGELPGASLVAVKGTLYSTTYEGGPGGCGTVYSINPDTDAETVLQSFCKHPWKMGRKHGKNPEAPVTDLKDTLYSTTFNGGAYYQGSVFSLKP